MGDAERTEDECDETDETEEGGGIVDGFGDILATVAIVANEDAVEVFMNVVLEGVEVGAGVQAEEEAAGGAAAVLHESGLFECGARDDDAHAGPEAGGETVRLSRDFASDFELLAANADAIADVHFEADEKFVGYDGVIIAGEQLLQGNIGLEAELAIERVDGRVHGFDGNHLRNAWAAASDRRSHRDGLSYAC